MDSRDLDLPTLAALAGGGVGPAVIARLTAQGFPGVKPSHGFVLQRLIEDEPTVGALARTLGMTQQGASKQVSDLEDLGYVERVPVPGDARARRVRLTDAGRGLLEAARGARSQLEAEVRARVPSSAVQPTREVLVALLEVVGLDDRVRTRTVPQPDA